MKTGLFFIAIFFLMLCPDTASAQYYNDFGGGVDRSIGSEVRQNKPKKNSKEKVDMGENWATYLDKEIKLDGLQFAAVKAIINDNKNSIEEISKSNLHVQEKKDKMREIMDKIDVEILKLLSKDQAAKYLKMKEDSEKKAMTN
ncbi:hypothetical protein [Flavobacterium lindanitolerans]|jgi:hypothetical protein|uniref:hypothetical protein n=1 Tax=Flavobacterium lindanitolerans TaxID=428988 RepID=UPI0012064AD2|nr:hypothetical protein [Flavobacterium lindanitolerans]MBL7868778.1 hypothetical protein [Flavobacterium lindanitolerans]THD34048.1 MAG: hypothetical protein DI588_02595 [Flavobacterium johnsoniae]